MNKSDGGPAFPGPYVNEDKSLEVLWKQQGMTLRDYFAAKAMQSLTIRQGPGGFDFLTFPDDPVRFGKWAYDIADAMLKAREGAG